MTTKQIGHTPGPWMPSASPTWSHCIYNKDGCVAQGNDPYSIVKNSELATANAAFIITACNSHEILLEACKEMYFELLAYQDKHPKIKSIDMVRWDQTISRAKGETQ